MHDNTGHDDTGPAHLAAPARDHDDENMTASASRTVNDAFLATDGVARPPLCARLVPNELLVSMASLVPPPPRRPQGGGQGRVSERDVLTAMVYVLTSGTSWRGLPSVFGVAVPTVYRRFVEWSDHGLWATLRSASFDDPQLEQWVHTIADTALARVPVKNPKPPPCAPAESWSTTLSGDGTMTEAIHTSSELPAPDAPHAPWTVGGADGGATYHLWRQ